MKTTAVDFPHPVLTTTSNDFQSGEFKISIVNFDDNDPNFLRLDIAYDLTNNDLVTLVDSGDAKIILRTICKRASYRKIDNMSIDGITHVEIPKQNVVDQIDLESYVVANTNNVKYMSEDFNQAYFGELSFKLDKGAVIAIADSLKIKIESFTEKSMLGIVQVSNGGDIDNLEIKYPDENEGNIKYADNIVILLPENDYRKYAQMRSKPRYRNQTERFLQSSLILPVITEALWILKTDEQNKYDDVLWANSIRMKLSDEDIDLKDTQYSCLQIANLILGNVESDSLNKLDDYLSKSCKIGEED